MLQKIFQETAIKEMENKIHDMGRSELSYNHNNNNNNHNNNKRNNNNSETVALQNANEKLLSQVQAHKQAVEGYKKANEEAHEEVPFLLQFWTLQF